MNTRFSIRFVEAGYWTVTRLLRNNDDTWSVSDVLEFNEGVSLSDAYAGALYYIVGP